LLYSSNYQLSVVAKDVVRSSLELHKDQVMCGVCTNLGKSLKVLDSPGAG